jgi:hypothetical protein
MSRKKYMSVTGLFALLACTAASQADIVWQMADNYGYFNKNNWIDTTTGLQYTTTMASGTAVNKAMIINSGFPGGSGAASSLSIGATGSLTVNGGVLRFSSTPDFSVGDNFISNGGDSNATGQPPVNITGGRVICKSVKDVAVTLSGTGVLELTGNSSVADNASDPIARTAFVNITSDGAVLRFLRKNTATVIADHVNNGEIKIDGNPLVLGIDPTVWEPGDNAVISTITTQDFATVTSVVRQVAARGQCVSTIDGSVSVTYQANCNDGSGLGWTAGGNANGSCQVGTLCTPVTKSADCAAMGGTYTLGASCAGALFQPADPGFENAVIPSVATPPTTLNDPSDFCSEVTTWWDADDQYSRVVYEASANANLTAQANMPETSDGTKWGVVNNYGLYTRIGNYDPAQTYKFTMTVGDRDDTVFNNISVSVYSGKFAPVDNSTPGGLFGTLIGSTTVTEASISWATTSAHGRTATISVNVPNNGSGVLGDPIYLRLYNGIANNGTGTGATTTLVDAIQVAVTGTCSIPGVGCAITTADQCTADGSTFTPNVYACVYSGTTTTQWTNAAASNDLFTAGNWNDLATNAAWQPAYGGFAFTSSQNSPTPITSSSSNSLVMQVDTTLPGVTPGTVGGTGANPLWLGPKGSLSVAAGTVAFITGTGAGATTGLIGTTNTALPSSNLRPVLISGTGIISATYVRNATVTVSGSGSLVLTGSATSDAVAPTNSVASDPIAFGATVNLTSPQATVHFVNKLAANVLADHGSNGELLINGAAPITGADPAVFESGDNCTIISDGATGCIVQIAAFVPPTCVADFNGDGDVGTDLDIEAFFSCLAGNCCATCGSPDFNGDGDVGTDRDIESFFSVLAGGPC